MRFWGWWSAKKDDPTTFRDSYGKDRHEDGKRVRKLFVRARKKRPEVVLERVREVIPTIPPHTPFTAEILAYRLKLRKSQVEHALHKLNLEGMVTQRHNHAPHDCHRAWPWIGVASMWGASLYYVRGPND